jgi:hypothetical protein
MKNLLLTISLFFCTISFSMASEVYLFGKTVEVSNKKEITFMTDFIGKTTNFKVTVEEYFGFECKATLETINDKLLVKVSWLPGADYSGCKVNLYDGEKLLKSTELFMSY